MTTITVQPLKKGEEDIIVEIHNLGFKPWIEQLGLLYGYKYITKSDVLSWMNGNSIIWLAYQDKIPVAYAHCVIEELSGEKGNFKQLVFVETLESLGQSKMVVHPSYQRKGIGKVFVKKLLEHYSKIGIKTALVLAYSDNESSNNLLSALEFKHSREFFYPNFSQKTPLCADSVLATIDLQQEIPLPTINNKVIIRSIQERDLPNIRIIFEESRPDAFGPNPTLKRIQEWYNSGWGETTLVAEYKGEAVGCMEFTSQGIIGIPGILKTYQKKGIGSTLFYYLLKTMQEKGFTLALADTGYSLEDAIKLYKRFNFNLSRELWSWYKVLQ
ncbi:MAG: GNAT family N-acetyltransferase [Candidatus Thorarchaeota archaeon]